MIFLLTGMQSSDWLVSGLLHLDDTLTLLASTRAGGPPWSYADGLLELEPMLLDVLDL